MLPTVVQLHAVTEGCPLLPRGTVTGTSPVGLARWAWPPNWACRDARRRGLRSLTKSAGRFWLATLPVEMSPGGSDGPRGDGKGKGNVLPADYCPPGGVRVNTSSAHATGGALRTRPASSADVTPPLRDVESLKAEVKTLRLRLTAQEVTNKSLATTNDELLSYLATLRNAVPYGESDEPKSRRKTTDDYKSRPKRDEPSTYRDLPFGSVTSRPDRARILRMELRRVENKTRLARSVASRAKNATESDSNASGSSSGKTASSLPGPSGPRCPPSSPSSDSGNVSSDTDSNAETQRSGLGPHKGRSKTKKQLEKSDRQKVIRPANSRFATLMDYRTYFLVRRDVSYPPSLVKKAHKMNRYLEGAFQGQEPFTGASSLGVFTFLTTFAHATWPG